MYQANGKGRIWELDFFRGIALFMMIYFHIIFDMNSIFGIKVNYETGINNSIGTASGVLFIFISGIASYLSSNNLKNGIKVLLSGMLITLVSWLYSPSLIIRFGILHFLGTCIILSILLKKINRYLLIALAICIIALGFLIDDIYVSKNYLYILGLVNNTFDSSDYYPLIPWMGVFLLGISWGKIFYKDKKSFFNKEMRDNIINTAGRHTLLVYLLHQPLILVILTVLL